MEQFVAERPLSAASIPLETSAHRSFHKRSDLCLFGGGQLRERVLTRPHAAVVEVRLVAEAEVVISGIELPCVLEEADDIAILGVRGHSIPGFRCEARCCGP